MGLVHSGLRWATDLAWPGSNLEIGAQNRCALATRHWSCWSSSLKQQPGMTDRLCSSSRPHSFREALVELLILSSSQTCWLSNLIDCLPMTESSTHPFDVVALLIAMSLEGLSQCLLFLLKHSITLALTIRELQAEGPSSFITDSSSANHKHLDVHLVPTSSEA